MQEANTTALDFPSTESKDVLTEILREGAQTLLVQAIEGEVADWIECHANIKDQDGHRLVVRNGRLPKRKITTGVGQIEIEQPRVHDRRPAAEAEKFTSKFLPPYLRKTKSIEELIPWLYLKGISTNDFGEALEAILGREVPGLSATTFPASKESGRRNTATGRSVRWKESNTCTCGPTVGISTSGWRKIVSASWSSWELPKTGKKS